MADSGATFIKMVPGFEFLQGLVQNAGAALPSVGQWIAPTLNPEEIERRIEELRTVQFWLEQNARMLAATIQALEVQRMTLSTLKTMNVSVGELRDSMMLSTPEAAPAAAAAGHADSAAAARAKPRAKKRRAAAPSAPSGTDAPPTPAPAGVVDPMQWWNALTRQFTQLAASALKDAGAAAAAATPAPASKEPVATPERGAAAPVPAASAAKTARRDGDHAAPRPSTRAAARSRR